MLCLQESICCADCIILLRHRRSTIRYGKVVIADVNEIVDSGTQVMRSIAFQGLENTSVELDIGGYANSGAYTEVVWSACVVDIHLGARLSLY